MTDENTPPFMAGYSFLGATEKGVSLHQGIPPFLLEPESSRSYFFQVPAFLADDLFIDFEIVGQKKRKRAININGSAIGGLKKIKGLP